VNVFASDRFLQAANDAHFGGRASVVIVDVDGKRIRTLVNDGVAVTDLPFLDFFETTTEPATVKAKYAPRVVTEQIEAAAWLADVPFWPRPAPTIDWKRFDDWAAFEAHIKSNRKNLLSDTRRRERRLVEMAGELTFAVRDEDPDAFDACVRWKIEQYAASGVENALEEPKTVDMMRRLCRDGVGLVSTLRAGGRLVAAHIGLELDGRHYWWVPAYDGELSDVAPGRILLHHLMRYSYDAGDTEFDFLIGHEDYKWFYATTTRVVQEVGRAPLPRQLYRGKVDFLNAHPRSRAMLKSVKATVSGAKKATV
jgi:hypothetical protein